MLKWLTFHCKVPLTLFRLFFLNPQINLDLEMRFVGLNFRIISVVLTLPPQKCAGVFWSVSFLRSLPSPQNSPLHSSVVSFCPCPSLGLADVLKELYPHGIVEGFPPAPVSAGWELNKTAFILFRSKCTHSQGWGDGCWPSSRPSAGFWALEKLQITG